MIAWDLLIVIALALLLGALAVAITLALVEGWKTDTIDDRMAAMVGAVFAVVLCAFAWNGLAGLVLR